MTEWTTLPFPSNADAHLRWSSSCSPFVDVFADCLEECLRVFTRYYRPGRARQDEWCYERPLSLWLRVSFRNGSPTRIAEKQYGTSIQPVFISVDPPRDTPNRVATYLSEFHPRLVGLTGSYQDTKSACKAYRVYFSTPPTAKVDDATTLRTTQSSSISWIQTDSLSMRLGRI